MVISKRIHNYKILQSSRSIAFIGQKGIPAEFIGTSGIEFYVEQRALRLVLQGKKIICYVRNWATPPSLKKYQGIRLVHLPSINTKHLDAFSHSFLASVWVCLTDADTVWYQAIGPSFFSFIPRIFGKKIITTIHGLDWKRDKWGPFARLFLRISEKAAVRFSNELLVVSSSLQKYYQEKYGINAHLDQPFIEKRSSVPPRIITQKYGLKGNDYVLFMGRFVPEKRIEWLIRAYKQLRLKNIKLVLAGGTSHSEQYVKSLKDIVGATTDIIFTDYALDQEKRELLSNCLLFVLPSSVEGYPIVLSEAHSLSRMCLISDAFLHEKHMRSDLVRYFREKDYVHFSTKLKQTLSEGVTTLLDSNTR